MKVNRNDPCPCGSGKKFKACCWKKSRPQNRLKNAKVITGGAGLFAKAHGSDEASTHKTMESIKERMNKKKESPGE